jgi:hypothetical protein
MVATGCLGKDTTASDTPLVAPTPYSMHPATQIPPPDQPTRAVTFELKYSRAGVEVRKFD